MRLFSKWTVLLAVVCVLAGSTVASAKVNWGRDFVSQRRDMLVALAEPVLECVGQVDRVDRNSPIFHGCYDWHSAVHGMYTLHVLYRHTGDQQYLDAINAVLKPELLEAELAYMQTTIRNRENPYGFAWFLSLAKERELALGKTDLRPLADFAAAAVVEWIESRDETTGPIAVHNDNYRNLSWAVIQLNLWAKHTGDEALRQVARDATNEWLLRPEFDVSCPVALDTDPNVRDYLPPCLFRLAAVAEVHGPHAKKWVAERAAGLSIPPVTQPVRVHSAGANFFRAVALWSIYESTRDVTYRDNFVELILAHMDQPQHWREDYDNYSHWVPQFGVRAIADTMGGN